MQHVSAVDLKKKKIKISADNCRTLFFFNFFIFIFVQFKLFDFVVICCSQTFQSMLVVKATVPSGIISDFELQN